MAQPVRRACILLLLALGALLWWSVRDVPNGTLPPVFFAAVVTTICLLPGVGDRLTALLDRVRHPSSKTRALASVVVAVLSALLLCVVALLRHRAFFPVLHDEQTYLLQTRMLAHGRLWLPAHPLANFLETFFVFVRPVYAPIYFPGTAVLFVAAIWLHVPVWVWALGVAGATVGLLFRIVAELVDTVAAATASLLLLSLPTFRGMSIFEMSHSAMAMLGLVMMLAWLKWRQRRAWGWAAVIGVATGWAAITRPADAVVFAGVVGVAMAIDLAGCAVKAWVTTAAAVILAAAPFLAVQIMFDLGVTGHPFETPYARYVRLEQPGTEFTLHPASIADNAAPVSQLEQKRAYYNQFLLPRIRRYKQAGLVMQWPLGKFAEVAEYALSHPVLLLPLAVSVVALVDRRRWVLWSTAPLLALIYSFNPFLLAWYMLSWMPGLIISVLLGVEAIAAALPRSAAMSAAFTVGIATLAIVTLVQPDQTNSELWRAPELEAMHWLDAFHPPEPAVVLFRFVPGFNVNEEPVYNTATAWPDDAWVVRLHDLGEVREREVFDYYAGRQPDREVYRFDLGSGELVDLGNVTDLAKARPNEAR
jgi:4-amino-4-deoxy-L-arabinose transferase-like glycosyltransferase